MSTAKEHEGEAFWQSLTGAQRRLVDRGLEEMEQGAAKPNALIMVICWDADPMDALKAMEWFHRLDREIAMEDRVRAILEGQGGV